MQNPQIERRNRVGDQKSVPTHLGRFRPGLEVDPDHFMHVGGRRTDEPAQRMTRVRQ